MDEEKTDQASEAQPNGTPEPIDWEAKYNELKKHSREWERKAKANKDAADELQTLKESQMSEAEKLQKQLSEANARADALQAEKDKAQWVSDAADATGVPVDLLSMVSATDRDDLMAKAESLAERYSTKAQAQASVPVVIGDGKHADVSGVGGNAEDDFVRFMTAVLK